MAAALSFVIVVPAVAQPSFNEVSLQAGVSYLQHSPQQGDDCLFAPQFCEPERMSGGAAVGDVDGDGRLDLFVTRLDAPDIVFRNQGDGTFADITRASGLNAFDLQSNAAGFADIDRDGDADLYVTVLGEEFDLTSNRNYLFVNDGRGFFTEQAQLRGAAVASPFVHRGYGVSFGDYDRDGWLDLHTVEWLSGLTSHARLLRNRGSMFPGFFEDATSAAGVALLAVDGFASAFRDLDDDGWPDLAVAADFGSSRLFWNNGDGTFTDGTVTAGVGTDENGMGSTIADYDGDGDLDWFVTSIFDPAETCETVPCNWGYTGNRLYRNDGGRQFSDVTDAAGVRDGAWGWGTAFFDYDNDGDLDLVMTNGVDFPGSDVELPFNADAMRLWENDGSGVMREVSAQVGVTDTGSGKGLLVFDYDADGDLDLFVVNNAAGPRLYRNDGGNDNDWLRVHAVGTASNRDAIGARVTVTSQFGTQSRTQVHEVGSAGHFLGQGERVAHFGLGAGADAVDTVLIEWPSGRLQAFREQPANSTLHAVEPVSERALSGGGTQVEGLNALGLMMPAGADLAAALQVLDQRLPGASVARLDPATQRFERCELDVDAQPSGVACNSPANPGDGWYVHAPQRRPFEYSIATSCPAVTLSPGQNLLALPCAADGLDAFELLAALGGGAVVDSVQSLEASSGRWRSAGLRNGLPGGPAFTIEPGGAYLVSARTSATYLPPVGDAGSDRIVELDGLPVSLDASGSVDTDTPQAQLEFRWVLVTPPASTAVLASPQQPVTTFVPDLPGRYAALLVVSDGLSASRDEVTVEVVTPAAGLPVAAAIR